MGQDTPANPSNMTGSSSEPPDFRPGAVAVIAIGAEYFARGDFRHCHEADLHHNIRLLLHQLVESAPKRRTSVQLAKDFDRGIHETRGITGLQIWRDQRAYQDTLWLVDQNGTFLCPAAWAIDPALGIHPCRPGDSFELRPPADRSCPVCHTTITAEIHFSYHGSASRELLSWHWRCPNWGSLEGHLWQVDYPDQRIVPVVETRRSSGRQRSPRARTRSQPLPHEPTKDPAHPAHDPPTPLAQYHVTEVESQLLRRTTG